MPHTSGIRPFSLGFIGGALHSAVGYAHRVACMMDNRWMLKAGCFSRNSAENRVTASTYGISPEHTYKDWQSMLLHEKGHLDAMAILTPTPTHAEIVIDCLKAGMPVICEKALAVDVADVRRIRTAQNKNKGFLAITYNYSGYPMMREFRSLISKGLLGKILHFQAEMPQEGFRRTDAQGKKTAPQSWRLEDHSIPTIYLDLGVHIHQLLYYLTGEHPLEVMADQRSYGWFNVIDNVICLCRYTEDIQGQIWFSKSALGHRNGLRIRIYGSEASAEWFQANPEEIVLSFMDGRRQIVDRAATVEVAQQRRYNRFKSGHPAGFVEAFANLYFDIADGLASFQKDGAWFSEEVFSVDLAAEGLAMLDAMGQSAKAGRWKAVEKQDAQVENL